MTTAEKTNILTESRVYTFLNYDLHMRTPDTSPPGNVKMIYLTGNNSLTYTTLVNIPNKTYHHFVYRNTRNKTTPVILTMEDSLFITDGENLSFMKLGVECVLEQELAPFMDIHPRNKELRSRLLKMLEEAKL